MKNTPDNSCGPLKGIKVLDLSRILAGPTCSQLLGDYGADIIKIEKPGAGDDTRKWGPPYVTDADGTETEESAYYLCANRNKRSVAVDIATPEGQRVVRALARDCDVLLENFKVGGLAKYGLSYDELAEINPDLVYCSITGFGQTGPNAHRPGYDLLAQGAGGIMSLTGEPDGEPMKVGVGVTDIVCGLYAATAILAALHHRDQGGGGQHIDIGLLDTQVAWLVNQGVNYLTDGREPERLGNQHPNIVPYQVFAVKDGHVIVAVGNDAQFRRFCGILGLEALADDPRYVSNIARIANKDSLIGTLASTLAGVEKEALIAAMDSASVPGGPINTVPEVFASEQVAAREMKIHMPHPATPDGVDLIGNPVKFGKTPVSYRHHPPLCGEHTGAVLEEFNISKGLKDDTA